MVLGGNLQRVPFGLIFSAGEVGLGTLSPLKRPEFTATAELASAVGGWGDASLGTVLRGRLLLRNKSSLGW